MVLRMRRRVILLIYKAVRIVLFDERQQIVLLHVDVPLWVEIASHNNQRGIATPRNSSSQHDPAAYLLAFGKYVAREAEVAPKLGQAVRNVQTNRFFQRPHRQKSCSRANWNRSLFCSLFSLTRSFAGPKMKCSSFARVFFVQYRVTHWCLCLSIPDESSFFNFRLPEHLLPHTFR